MTETISQTLQEAQNTLLKKRAEARQLRLEQGLPVVQHLDPEARRQMQQQLNEERLTQPSTADWISSLPTHLGWGTDAAAVTIRTALRRREAREEEISEVVGPGFTQVRVETSVQKASAAETAYQNCNPPVSAPKTLFDDEEETIKVYPALAAAMLKSQCAAQARVYFLMRYLDQGGRGWLFEEDVRVALTGKNSKLRIAKKKTSEANAWRNLRGLLKAGEGVFWTRDHLDRIWLHSTARIAVTLDSETLTGYPVGVPIQAFVAGIKKVRAYLYASFHVGRAKNDTKKGRVEQPISQQTLREVTAVSERSQTRYNRITKLKVRPNYIIGERYNDDRIKNVLYERGGNAFQFLDAHGRHGPRQACYIASRLPNSYHTTSLWQKPRGRQGKINQIIDLVTNVGEEGSPVEVGASSSLTSTRGNGGTRIDRLFFQGVKEAHKAHERKKHIDHYWLSRFCSRRDKVGFWYHMKNDAGCVFV